ncbi:hypothetical protein RI129_012613 [Pyrocoelia pectoralis]|uniref:DNA polymerase V n=1 Tax=Pyrocoelia pectoralis TaxID=417401 RepID=A0AAN7ZG69_9COLE
MAEDEHVARDIVTRKIGKSVLDHFAHISNENETKRIKNGSLLLQHLYKSSNNKDTSEIKYALKRIIRGLGGSKISSRAGFYSTLVALLRTFPHLTLEDILECIRGSLQTEGSNSKSEVAELYTGQILACGALIRSNKIFSGTIEEKEHILRVLVNAGKSRSYLSLASVRYLSELITTSSEKQFKELWHVLSGEIVKPWPSQNHDSLYLLLLTHRQFPTILKGGILQKAIGTPEILCEANFAAICNIVLNPSSFSMLKHFLYPLLAETLATTNHELIFVAELDRQLLRSNRIKLMAASLIVRHLLTSCQDSTIIPNLLSENFIKQLLQYYRNRTNRNDPEFQDEIASLFDSLCKSLQRDTVDVKTKLKVIKKLIFHPGSFMFENVTKSKNIQKLVRILDKESVKKLGGLYRDVLIMKREKVCENKMESWLNSERIYAAQLLAKLLILPVVQTETSWKVKNLRLLMDVAVLRNKYTNVGIELANNVKEAFFRALDLRFSKLDDVASVLGELVGYLQTECNNLRISLDEDELAMLGQLCSITTKKAENECGLVFQVLFLHMGLQLFNDKELAVSSLNELFACHEKVAHKQKEGDENDPEWIDVVIDLFLNLLSHNSLLLRNIVGAVFPYLCKYVTASSLHQILSVLDPNSDTNPLSLDESDSESEGDDSEEAAESDLEEDNETVNDRLRMAVRDALGNNGYQTDEESVDLDDMTEEDAEKLDKALVVAFKQFKPNRGKSKKQSKQEETLTHFRIRVMDLLEIYLDSEPVMLSCLEMMLPLLQILEFAIKDEHQKPLLMRIRHCIRKLSHLKKFSSTDGVTDAVVADFLNSLLEKGTKNAILVREMSNEISDCCIFVIKCSQNDALHTKVKRKCENRITTILSNAIVVYFKQRDCLTPYGLFKSIFQLNWEGSLKFLPLLFSFVFDTEIRPFRRNQALELLKLFYQNRRVHSKYAEIVGGHEREFLDNVIRILDDFCRNPQEKTIREKFIYNLLSLLKTIYLHPDKNGEVDWESIGEKVREFRSHVPLSKEAKAMYNQLCREMKISHLVKMSENVVKFSNKEMDDEVPHKKQSPAIEARKLKKEAKTRRVQNMSEGIGNFSFTNLQPVENIISDNDDSVSSSKVNGVQRKRRKSGSDLEKVSRKKKVKHNLTLS